MSEKAERGETVSALPSLEELEKQDLSVADLAAAGALLQPEAAARRRETLDLLRLREISPARLRELTNADLAELDRRLHDVFGAQFAETQRTSLPGVGSREDVVNAHRFLVADARRRRFRLRPDADGDALTRETKALARSSAAKAGDEKPEDAKEEPPLLEVAPSGERSGGPRIFLSDVLGRLDGDAELRHPAVFLVGSVPNRGYSDNDIDLLLRGPIDPSLRDAIEFRIGRALGPLASRVQWHVEGDDDGADLGGGPFTSHVPLFDLVLRRTERELVRMSEPVGKQGAPFTRYPPKPGPRRAILHNHLRGKSLHTDYRVDLDGESLTGWTLLTQRAGVLREEVETITAARETVAGAAFGGSRFMKPFEAPANVRAEPKPPQPPAWLKVGDECFPPGAVGATRFEPGCFATIVGPDRLRVTFGLLKPFAVEHFVEGDRRWAGILTFRLLVGGRSPSETEVEAGRVARPGQAFWLARYLVDLTPSVLRRRAVKRGARSFPPLGHPGIPEGLVEAVPSELRWWKAKTVKEGVAQRDEVVELGIFTEDSVKVVDGRFRLVTSKRRIWSGPWPVAKQERARAVLSRQTFRGQVVVRLGPSEELFHLALDPEDGSPIAWTFQQEPRPGARVAAVRRDDLARLLLDPPKEPEPGTKLNPKKATPSRVEVEADVQAKVIESGRDLWRFRVSGRGPLSGTWLLAAEEPGSKVWLLERGLGDSAALEAEAPEEKAEETDQGQESEDPPPTQAEEKGVARIVRGIVVRRELMDAPPGQKDSRQTFTYTVAVGPVLAKDVGRLLDVVEIDGRSYAPIGRTGPTDVDARRGATLEAEVLELFAKLGDRARVRWLGSAQVQRIVEGPPMSVADVVELAREGEVEKQDDRTVAEKVAAGREVPILKIDQEERIVLGVVLEPGIVDVQDDTYSEVEIEKAANSFGEHGLFQLNLMHKVPLDRTQVVVLQSFVTPETFWIGGRRVRKGSWLLKIRILDAALWVRVKSGQITGFSIEGSARRVPVDEPETAGAKT